MFSDLPQIVTFVIGTVAIIIVLTMHAFAKAFAAVKCGDLTPKINGRLTLNPLAHFDYIGLAFFALAGFGWSRPVPINPTNFKKIRSGLAWTSISGILCNILTAFVAWPLYLLVVRFMPAGYFTSLLGLFFFYLSLYSISYAAFNLIPLPPMDAWQLIDALAKKRGKVFRFFQYNGIYIFYALLGYHFIVNIFAQYSAGYAAILRYADLFAYFQRFVVNSISMPIQMLWGWVFSL